jgi:hypothetical protein
MADPRLEPLVLSQAERRTLENWAKRRKTAQGLALRARIVLACAEAGRISPLPRGAGNPVPHRQVVLADGAGDQRDAAGAWRCRL